MKYLVATFILLLGQEVIAKTEKGLERINFFPNVKAYAAFEFHNQNLLITTPKNAVNDTEIRNNRNLFAASYGHRVDNVFLGLTGFYEIASESAANFGIPSNKRSNSQGLKEPAIFFLSRLRQQKGTTGNIDFYLSFTDNWGAREVGGSTSNRLNGFNILQARLSHGMHEDLWEFRNRFSYTFHDEGEEHNKFTKGRYDIGSFNVFCYSFTGQYEYNPWLFLNATAEFEYRTIQKISSRREADGKREIQAGTGSIFRIGAKRPLNDWSVVELNAELKRYDYFVQGDNNFDGKAIQTTYSLSYTHGF